MPIASRHDQAAGLRQMFAGACARFVPVVSNPHVVCGGVLLERLSTAFAERGARVLVVDAGESAGSAGEMAMVDLGAVRRAAVAAGRLPRRARPGDPLRRCRRLDARVPRARRRSGARLRRRPRPCDRERAVPDVRARAPRRPRPGRRRPAVPDRRRRRPSAERDPCLRVDEAARAARRPRRQPSCCSAPRRTRRAPSGSPPSWPAAPTTSSPACCATGPGSTRPATRATPRAATCAVIVAARFENHAAIGASGRPAARRAHRRGGSMMSGATMYTAKGQLDLNSTLKQYSGLVRRLAHQMIAKLPANVEIDDLIQVGMIGLTDALSRFDAAQGVQFETFATQRIRGAMLDELRGNDYLSRGTRKHQRSIESAVVQARAAARPRAAGKRDRQGDGHQPDRIPGAARQGARHPAGLPRGHVGRRRRQRLPRPPRRRRRVQSARAAAGPAHARAR